MAESALHLIIHGRVQGVGYRSWAAGNAKKYALKGWVRNRDDGTVELLICGAPENIATMRKECERGPLASNVLRIEAENWKGAVPQDFHQLPTSHV